MSRPPENRGAARGEAQLVDPSHLLPREPLPSAHNWHNPSIPLSLRGATPLVEDPELGAVVHSGAEAIVHQLCELGLTTFFGIPGGPVMPVFHALLNHPAACLIESRHETGAVFAAMGFHRATGKVPVVVVTAGPGATNAVTGVAAAALERVPMVILCGDVPWAATGRKLFQDSGPQGVDIAHMLAGLTRAQVTIAHPHSAAGQVRAAIFAAVQPERPGPVLVVASIDRAKARAQAPRLLGPPLSPPLGSVAPNSALMHQAYQLLQRAHRPLVLLGAGCRPAQPQVQRMIDALGVPFMTTPQAKGLISEDHPLSLRNCGVASSLWAQRYTSSPPDVTLVMGTDLDDLVTSTTPPVGPGGILIHVDHDAAAIGRNIPAAIGAVFDLRVFADALTGTARIQGPPRPAPDVLREIKEGPPSDRSQPDDQVPIAPHRVVLDLEQAAWPRTTFVLDIGEHNLHALHHLTITGERRLVVHQGLGSMGSGICSAIGLSLGDPEGRVVCICGDGGMQMFGMELSVAVKLRLPIVYAVFNDGRYNMVYHIYKVLYGTAAAWDTPQVDFVRWAESLGARGQRIERPGQITRPLLEELTAHGPAVLDVRHDASVRLRNSGRAELLSNLSDAKVGA